MNLEPALAAQSISAEQSAIPTIILTDTPPIEKLRKMFDDARDDSSGNQIKCQRDRDYYDGPKQLDSDVRRVLKSRGQPAIYTNRVRPAVNGVLGVLEAADSDPRAYPRNPGDEDAADVCTKTLRYIADKCNFDELKQECAENFLIEGTCAAIMEMDGPNILPTQIRWEEFFVDRYARRSDCKDAQYMGIAKWQDASVVHQKYGKRVEEIGDIMSSSGGLFGDKWADRPEGGQQWIDNKRQRVMLIEMYALIDGKWMRAVFCGRGVLEYGESPYLDDKKRPCNPIEAQSCFVDRENNRYGYVRDMVPIQDEINASRSRSLHLMNSRQVQQTDLSAPPVDDAIVRAEAAKADGVLPMGWNIVQHADVTSANMARMQEAKSEIERMGPTPAVLGQQGSSGESGRARMVLQAAGMTEIARPLARLNDWAMRCYQQMWMRAQQYWTAQMYIRVTNEAKAPDFLQINEPIAGPVPVMGPDGQPVIDPTTGAPQMQMGQVGVKNRPAEMDMDIILDTTPDSPNLQSEVFGDLVKLVAEAGGLQAIFTPQFEVMIELSPLADKHEVIEKLKQKQEEIAQQQQQGNAAKEGLEQHAQELQSAAAVAGIQKTVSETELNKAKAQAEPARAAHAAAQANNANAEAGLADGKNAVAEATAASQYADMESQHARTMIDFLGVNAPPTDGI